MTPNDQQRGSVVDPDAGESLGHTGRSGGCSLGRGATPAGAAGRTFGDPVYASYDIDLDDLPARWLTV